MLRAYGMRPLRIATPCALVGADPEDWSASLMLDGATVPTALEFRLLGGLAAMAKAGADAGAGAVTLPANRKTRALLGVLLAEAPQPVARDTLCALLWPGRAAQARGSLRQALHEVSTVFRAQGIVLLAAPSREDVALEPALLAGGAACDVWAARDATALRPDAVERVALRLLPELRGLGAAFDAWREAAEGRLLRRARIVAETALALADGADARSAAGELLLRLDPGHRAGWEVRVDAAARLGDPARSAELRATMMVAGAAPGTHPGTNPGPGPGAGPGPGLGPRAWSIAVQPFRAISGAPAEAAAMLTDTLAASLPRLRWLRVFAPAPEEAHAAGGLGGGAAQDGSVVFRLDGTVRQSGGSARAVIRLTDAHSGEILWAETFDASGGPETVADPVCARAEPAMLRRAGEIAQARLGTQPDGTANPARDLVLSAIPATYRLTRDGFARAGALLSTAIGRDPEDPVAHAWAAYWHVLEAGQGWSADPGLSIRRAGELAARAVALDPLDARALTIAGHVRAFMGRSVEEALALHAHALSRNPALPLAWTLSGLALAYAGRHEESLAHIARARALAPCDPHGFFNDMATMVPLLALGRDEAVVAHARQAATLNPALSSTHKGWLSALGHLGRRSEQAEVRARLFEIEPGFSALGAAARSPYLRAIDRERYVSGLRLAGLRD